MTDDKLARLKRNIDLSKRSRHQDEPPELPKQEMFTRPMTREEAKAPSWQEQMAKHRGSGYLHGENTAQFPTPLFMNWPVHLRDALYSWTWENHNTAGGVSLAPLLAQLGDRDVKKILDALETFKSDDLTTIGAQFYKGLLDEEERREKKTSLQGKVRVAAHHDDDEEVEELEAPKIAKRLGQ